MPKTPISLLRRLREPGQPDAWQRFVDLYTPLLLFWARRAGLQEQDAADLAQDVFATLLWKLPELNYQPGEQGGRFRAWLRTIALNKWRDSLKKRRVPIADGAAGLSDVAGPDDFEALWEAEHQQRLVARALELMQVDFEPTTWKACWELVAQGRPAADVARELGISPNAVYIAKGRVLRRLRQELDGLLD
jgi:RNA polymerase sigma-70 factor, ECF subfamily